MNKGLYALAGASATATAAACANRLLEPITKVSKVYLGFSRAGPPCVRLPRPSHLFCTVPAPPDPPTPPTPPAPGGAAGGAPRSKESGSDRAGDGCAG